MLYLGVVAAAGLLARPAPADLPASLTVVLGNAVMADGLDEAASMAAYLAAQGVPAAAALDPQGMDTWATARATAALLGGSGRVIVAAQWFHVPRTLLALRRFGVAGAGAAWPVFWEARDLASFMREAVALPWYAVRPVR